MGSLYKCAAGLLFCLLGLSCQNSTTSFPIPTTSSPKLERKGFEGSKDQFYDKVLGCLVGSAIGDAMGSPVEMWTQQAIRETYGFIDRPIANIRPASPEGPWQGNLAAGTTTDDTRWKYLLAQYLLDLPAGQFPDDLSFAQFVSRQYDLIKKDIVQRDGFRAEALEENGRYLIWLQEWVKVADAYQSGDVQTYATAASKFYGGEMSCAGMLYAPLLGILYPNQPQLAYEQSWPLTFFDLGYAKDISAMTAALVAAAFHPTASTDSLLAIHSWVDQQAYGKSRLIGRIVNNIYQDANNNYQQSLQASSSPNPKQLPAHFQGDAQRYAQLQSMYGRLQQQLKSIPFHADEIYRITLNSLLYAEGDFMDAMCFLTNFGRDNDTVGAVVGAIMGAQLGYSALPEDIREQVLQINKEQLQIDLQALAQALADRYHR
ncbi:MAG: ADP-ribosylglycohydrolase family protein [Bacteroidota bacterium]